MRVLLVPEVYRRDDLSANGTVTDAVAWVADWLERAPSLHVYWLLLPREMAAYDAADVRADRERVTLLEAEPYGAGLEPTAMFTEDGYSEAELRAIDRGIREPGAYVDAVVDGRRAGRRTLVKWLLADADQWAARVRPFDVIANVHDLQHPQKYRYCAYRDRYQGRLALCEAAFADGIWFTAPVDARAYREHANEILVDDVVETALAERREIGSPLPFDRFEETYADRPQWLHVAGSLWEKKCADTILDIGATLNERFGIRTLLTSVEAIPRAYADREWVEAHSNADRATYERALSRGDLAICASEYETLARTWFEQAASGQVLLLRDEPWVSDCVPEDHLLVAPLEALESLAVAVVERWDEAVAANRDLVAHLERVRAPDRVGERTYADLRRRVDAKTGRYVREADDGADRDCDNGIVSHVADALERVDGDRVPLETALERTRAARDTGDADSDPIADTDVRYALRALGWRDAGDPGTPTFVRRVTDDASGDR
ncbi:glycosyltransferase family 1 protein [Natrinema sp. 74]|uniref:glycosyltransferase family 1 protein n=1 Tax=Natrinema sp. 74 TaxID=3384159 RepID=UPI0038D3A3B6